MNPRGFSYAEMSPGQGGKPSTVQQNEQRRAGFGRSGQIHPEFPLLRLNVLLFCEELIPHQRVVVRLTPKATIAVERERLKK